MKDIKSLISNDWIEKCFGPWGGVIVLASNPCQEHIPYLFYTGGTLFRSIFTALVKVNLGLLYTYRVNHSIQRVLFHRYASLNPQILTAATQTVSF